MDANDETSRLEDRAGRAINLMRAVLRSLKHRCTVRATRVAKHQLPAGCGRVERARTVLYPLAAGYEAIRTHGSLYSSSICSSM
jgi:uncharacterized protein (DUF2267 family)